MSTKHLERNGVSPSPNRPQSPHSLNLMSDPHLPSGSELCPKPAPGFCSRCRKSFSESFGIGRLILECATQPGKMHRRILEPLADLLALGPGEIDLDLVSMPGTQLDAGIAELLEPEKNRGEIPVLGGCP